MQSFQTLIKPTLDNKPYRLKCRFKIEPLWDKECPLPEKMKRWEWLRRGRARVIEEMFIAEMHKQGWEHDGRFGFKMTGPYPFVAPVQIKVPRVLKAREMAALVAQGVRFRDSGQDTASIVPELNCSEWWEFELAGVFVRPTILVEVPDLHEEIK